MNLPPGSGRSLRRKLEAARFSDEPRCRYPEKPVCPCKNSLNSVIYGISRRTGGKTMTLLIILIIIGILVVAVVSIYNKLVRLRNTVKSSWSDIDVQCKKRFDLVPNLVETVKGYASHERTVFEKVTEARSMAMKATTPAEMAKAENMLKDTLKSLFAVAEAYPELKANTNFLQLQTQLQELENNIEYARRYYNAVVRDYNVLIESFPSNLIASQFSFKQAELFQLETPEVERKPVKVSF
jgi:LemA protein